jgi:DNA-binding NarL/FixJ family response regulator
MLVISSTHVGWAWLRSFLHEWEEARVIADIALSDQAVPVARLARPDLILVAVMPQEPTVVPLVTDLHAASPTSKILPVGDPLPAVETAALVPAEVMAHLPWEYLRTETVPHILALALHTDLLMGTRSMRDSFLAAYAAKPAPMEIAVELTVQERAVLERLAAGLTRAQVCAQLQLSPRTMRRMISVLKVKLAAPSEFMLGVRAAQLGLAR